MYNSRRCSAGAIWTIVLFLNTAYKTTVSARYGAQSVVLGPDAVIQFIGMQHDAN